jgi:hypothetical protein
LSVNGDWNWTTCCTDFMLPKAIIVSVCLGAICEYMYAYVHQELTVSSFYHRFLDIIIRRFFSRGYNNNCFLRGCDFFLLYVICVFEQLLNITVTSTNSCGRIHLFNLQLPCLMCMSEWMWIYVWLSLYENLIWVLSDVCIGCDLCWLTVWL